eukprot:jgi/Hompol1/3829/HPOL_006765-RA
MSTDRLAGSASALNICYLDLSAFPGQPPPKTPLGITDYDFETIPRAIYNDPIQDLLLREEGYSGRPRKEILDGLAPLKPAHPTIEASIPSFKTAAQYRHQYDPARNLVDVTKDALQQAEQEGDTRTVVITDCGIEIINPYIRRTIRPFNKPKFRSPMDRPIHSEAGAHKAAVPKFSSTVRYASRLNTLASTNTMTTITANRRSIEMQRGIDRSTKPFVLRYNRAFDPIEPTSIARGVSFRGRRQLEARMGWSFSDNDEGDITTADGNAIDSSVASPRMT